jgi:hypothetical protein
VRRILLVLSVALMMAVMLVAAAPAMAGNSGTQPPGPPNISGNFPFTYVKHCSSHSGGEGSVVTNKNGVQHGGGDC